MSCNPSVRLVQISEDGCLVGREHLPQLVRESMPQCQRHFASVGYFPPWVGYVAFDGEVCVGVCAFKTRPQKNSVEISYGTAEEHRGKGFAKAMTRELVRMARTAEPSIIVTAQTLPEPSASTSVLARSGFVKTSEVQHPEDGLVWEWTLTPTEACHSVRAR